MAIQTLQSRRTAIWNELHEAAWGDASQVDLGRLTADLDRLVADWSMQIDSRRLGVDYSTFRKANEVGTSAETFFDVLDPLFELSLAKDALRAQDYQSALGSSWKAVDGLLLGRGTKLDGFEWVEPWAHDTKKCTDDFLQEFSDRASKKKIDNSLTAAFLNGARFVHALQFMTSTRYDSRAKSVVSMMPTMFQLANEFQAALGRQSVLYALWDVIPDEIVG